ncbi:MAG: 50S ribosomal protein L23 [Candidatus Adlerbacteria bacterium]|nr:50S ribosomal protein L23 [Candidatus Adlerbacteria bacterium]
MQKHSGKILLSPRITEKGAYLSDQDAYVFNVARTANKHEVAAAVFELFKVKPRMVRMLATPRKQVMTRGTNRTGMTAGGKKAYVFLKKGDKIEII